MASVNHVANLEALMALVGNGLEALASAWDEPAGGDGFRPSTEAEFNKLSTKLQGIRKHTTMTLAELRAGRGEAELDELDLKVKDAGRTAEKLRIDWRAEGQADEFLTLLSEAADVTIGPTPAGTINWLVTSARDGSLLA